MNSEPSKIFIHMVKWFLTKVRSFNGRKTVFPKTVLGELDIHMPRNEAQFSAVTQLCPTLCDPVGCSMPDLPIHHQLPEFTQTHVHWDGDAIQLSHPLLIPSPPIFNLSQHQDLFFPERNLHIYFHLIYDKRDKKLQWRKDSLFNMWCWENWTVSCKRRKSEQYLTPHININCKWIKDLNVRLGIIKMLEKNRQNTLWHKSQKDLL